MAISQVGYGDIYPISFLGKIIVLSNIIFGFTFILLIIIGIKKKINSSNDQIQMVYKTYKILKYKNDFKNKLIKYFKIFLINKNKAKNKIININIKESLNIFLNKMIVLKILCNRNKIIYLNFINRSLKYD